MCKDHKSHGDTPVQPVPRRQSRSENDWQWIKPFSLVMGPCDFAFLSLSVCGEDSWGDDCCISLLFLLCSFHVSEKAGMIQRPAMVIALNLRLPVVWNVA